MYVASAKLEPAVSSGKEYHRKTRKPNEMWAADCSYLRVVNWGCYLVIVMEDYSRYILAWGLKREWWGSTLKLGRLQPSVAFAAFIRSVS